ncbi:hypothetical protein FGB62_157g13 [Gracilaria domingensis]|nr:hypothetical protein FGB62_157g13 [Gracilaria domingensis]
MITLITCACTISRLLGSGFVAARTKAGKEALTKAPPNSNQRIGLQWHGLLFAFVDDQLLQRVQHPSRSSMTPGPITRTTILPGSYTCRMLRSPLVSVDDSTTISTTIADTPVAAVRAPVADTAGEEIEAVPVPSPQPDLRRRTCLQVPSVFAELVVRQQRNFTL